MAQQGRPEVVKYKFEDMNFPVLFDDGLVRVYKNPSDEIFVEDVRSGATMRISSYGHGDGGLQFTTNGRVEPIIQVNNMIGWRVGPR